MIYIKTEFIPPFARPTRAQTPSSPSPKTPPGERTRHTAANEHQETNQPKKRVQSMKPDCFKFSLKMMSLQASNTTFTLRVSVAHVMWW